MEKAALAACIALAFGAARLPAQAYTPPPPPLSTAPCVATKKNPCTQINAAPRTPAAADTNPFPGEPPAPGTPATPAAPTTAAPSAAEANPFPGEPPEAPATQSAPNAPGSANPFAGPGNSSSSSSSSSSSDAGDDPQPPLKDEGSEGSTRFERKRLPKPGRAPEDREAEDLDVSKFYSDKGDYHAAYLRAQDAIATLPADPEAHWLLANAARRLQKGAEARAEFETYLKMAPDGDHATAAAKLLQETKLK